MTSYKGDTKTICNAIRNFTTNFHKGVAEDNANNNFVSSALSAHACITMVASGAQGSTLREMHQALQLKGLAQKTLKEYHDLLSYLNNLTTPEDPRDAMMNMHLNQKPVPDIIKVATKIYIDTHFERTFGVKGKYKRIAKQYFCSECEFFDNTEKTKSVQVMNQWCDNATNSKIKKIISEDDITTDTAIILLNAIYFKGTWVDQFFTTDSQPFYINSNKIIQVPTMHQMNYFHYQFLKELDAECVYLPYKMRYLKMLIIVPKKIDDLTKLEENLEKINYEMINKNGTSTLVQLSLPKFKHETTIDLAELLKNLGIKEVFSDEANLRNIYIRKPTPTLKVDLVIQKATIDVNEKGTEAAAVTFVRLKGGGISEQPKPITLRVNRPFIYQIIDTERQIALFTGHIVEPKYT